VATVTGLLRRGLLYLLLSYLGAISLAWNQIAWIVYPLLPRRIGTALGRAVISHVYRGFWATTGVFGMLQVDAAALAALRDEPGGLILAANHPTSLDALVLVAFLPRGVCIMKADLMRNPFLAAGARLARYIRNDAPRGMMRCAVDCLREGGQLVMFPEGTRTVRRPLNPFQPGIALIARRAGVPIQAVIIETDTPYLRKGWPIWRAPAFPVRLRLRLGKRFLPGADHHALLERLERHVVAEVAGAAAPSAPERVPEAVHT
jgi:1-acyl-sn-glycerol-3-phosphate acyltransferase